MKEYVGVLWLPLTLVLICLFGLRLALAIHSILLIGFSLKLPGLYCENETNVDMIRRDLV